LHIADGRRANRNYMRDGGRTAPTVLNGERAKNRMSQDGDAIDPKLETNRLEIPRQLLQRQVTGVTRRVSSAAQIDKHQHEPITKGGRELLLVGPRADRREHDARSTGAAGGVVDFCIIARDSHGNTVASLPRAE